MSRYTDTDTRYRYTYEKNWYESVSVSVRSKLQESVSVSVWRIWGTLVSVIGIGYWYRLSVSIIGIDYRYRFFKVISVKSKKELVRIGKNRYHTD